MEYDDPKPIQREAAEIAMTRGREEEAAEALIRVALHDSDGPWAESFCLRGLRDQRDDVRRAAITGLGHIARLHHSIGNNTVRALEELRSDPVVGGTAEDSLSDISIFVFRYEGDAGG
jgi:hypothetical protein